MGERPPERRRQGRSPDRIEFSVNLNRRDVEALQLELRRMAKRLGIGIKAVSVKTLRGKI